jgi:hypothetical protein
MSHHSSGAAQFLESRQIALDVNLWTDIAAMAKARGTTTPKLLRSLIEIIFADGLVNAIIDDGKHERRTPSPPAPSRTPSSFRDALQPRLIAMIGVQR